MSGTTEDKAFVDSRDEIAETGQNVEAEDQAVEKSEATGQISQDEVAGLKDDLSQGESLDDSEGYTRSGNKDADPLKQEREVDAAVEDLE